MAKNANQYCQLPSIKCYNKVNYLANAPVIDISNSHYYKLYHSKKYSLGFNIMTFHYLLLSRILQCT